MVGRIAQQVHPLKTYSLIISSASCGKWKHKNAETENSKRFIEREKVLNAQKTLDWKSSRLDIQASIIFSQMV